MAIVTLLIVLAGLWASISLIALTLLSAVYAAERAGWRRDRPASTPERPASIPDRSASAPERSARTPIAA